MHKMAVEKKTCLFVTSELSCTKLYTLLVRQLVSLLLIG
jgi:hypothetical protein